MIQNSNSIYTFSTLHKKNPSKPQCLDFRTCSGENLLNPKSFLKAQVIFPSTFASIFSAIKNNSSIFFLAETLFTLVKSSLLKCKYLRFSNALVKICQIPHVNFELTSKFLFNFCIIFYCHDR